MTNTLLKLIFILYSSLIIIVESNLIILTIYLFFITSVIIFYKIKLPIKYIIFLTIPIYLLFFIIFSIDTQNINLFVIKQSFLNGSLMIIKLLILILINLWFIVSSSPLKFISALKKIGLSNNISIAFLLLIGIIPNTLKTVIQIYYAQVLRGFNKRDLLTTKGWKLFLVPLFIYVFSYSQQITIQIKLKDYSSYTTNEDNTSITSFGIFIVTIFLISFFKFSNFSKIL